MDVVNVDVVKDILDKPVIDRNGRHMGRVDGIELDLSAGEPPRLSSILIGPTALGFRLHPTIGRWIGALERAFDVDQERPVRIDFRSVTEVGRDIRVDITIAETKAEVVERRLRAWLSNIPERE